MAAELADCVGQRGEVRLAVLHGVVPEPATRLLFRNFSFRNFYVMFVRRD
jgi:hypothetical protein